MASPDGAHGAAPLLPGRFHGVVLDLDGLLVETEQVWSRAKELLFERHGVAYGREDHLAVLGTSDEATAVHFTRRFGLPAEHTDGVRLEYLDIADELFRVPVNVTEGARELVAWLRGRVPLALASNTRRPLVERILAGAALAGAFDAVVTGDDGRPKPAPDLYLLACRRLGVAPSGSVALEDSPTGVAAAQAAGLRCIGVPSSPDVRLDAADHVVRSLLEVMPSPAARADAARVDAAPVDGARGAAVVAARGAAVVAARGAAVVATRGASVQAARGTSVGAADEAAVDQAEGAGGLVRPAARPSA